MTDALKDLQAERDRLLARQQQAQQSVDYAKAAGFIAAVTFGLTTFFTKRVTVTGTRVAVALVSGLMKLRGLKIALAKYLASKEEAKSQAELESIEVGLALLESNIAILEGAQDQAREGAASELFNRSVDHVERPVEAGGRDPHTRVA